MKNLFKALGLMIMLAGLSGTAKAAVSPDFFNNNQNHELSRSEKKCIDEGYKITYANCSNQTAPADRCPHHDSYYRSCSQEQWCRNNNFRFLATDCKLPLYPLKMCDNKFPLYRACRENVIKACEDSGFVSQDSCKLTEKRCPYSPTFGICCGQCEDFSTQLKKIPDGYVADGETCTTCDGIVKTNIKPASCEGFQACTYGPMSAQTPSCRQADSILYTACKTADTICKEKGFIVNSCAATEDTIDCPENPAFKKCSTNCLKLAQSLYPEADIIGTNTVNPQLDLTKKEIRSLVGMSHPDCLNLKRPTVEINLNNRNLELYQDVFNRNLNNVNFKLNFEEPISFNANGTFNNVKISVSGNLSACPFNSQLTQVTGVVSFIGTPQLCMNFEVTPESKLLSDGSVRGNIKLGKDSSLGLKGDLNGSLRSGSYTEVFIKGKLEFNDPLNSEEDSESIVFGCNSKNKIVKGIVADTSSVILKQWAKVDTADITMKSTSDNLKLPNTLASVHLYKYAKLFSTYGNDENTTVFPLVENNNEQNCEDKYYIHLGSAVNTQMQTIVLEPSERLDNKWECRKLRYKQQQCD